MPHHKRLLLAAPLLIAAILAIGLLTRDRAAPPSPPDADPFSPAPPPHSPLAPPRDAAGIAASPPHDARPAAPSGGPADLRPLTHAAAHNPTHDAPQAGPTVVIIGQDGLPTSPARDIPAEPDWDALPHEPFGPDAGWADPTQQEILGPPRWMAQPTSASARELAAAIDAGPAPAELKRQEQTRGLREAAARLTLERGGRCIHKWRAQQPDLTGRLDVALTMTATDQRATVTQVRVIATARVEEAELADCVRASLANAHIASSGALPKPVTFEFSLPVGP